LQNAIAKCHCKMPLQNAIAKCHCKMPLQNAIEKLTAAVAALFLGQCGRKQ
jgi:hypothetical protein